MIKNILLVIFCCCSVLPILGQTIYQQQQDSSKYAAIKELHNSIKNFTVVEEILLFKTIRDSISAELEQIDHKGCLLYTSPSPRDATLSRMPSSA